MEENDFRQMEREAYDAAAAVAERAFALGRQAERIAGALRHQMDGGELHPVRAAGRLRRQWRDAQRIEQDIAALEDVLTAWQNALPTIADVAGKYAIKRESDPATE